MQVVGLLTQQRIASPEYDNENTKVHALSAHTAN